MDNLVSIITPAYNSEKFISETILSVQSQTYSNWEMIIVDDCSSDKTVSIVQNFIKKDARIKLLQLSKNSGTGIARNTALEEAKGYYIAFLDADDLWMPEKLSKQIDFMRNNHLIFTYSFYDCINEAGNPLNIRVTTPKKLLYRQLFFCNFIGNLTGIYDANFIGKIPISPIRKRQDWMMWLTIAKRLQYSLPVPESLALYRVREDSISASKISLLQHNYTVYRKHHHYNIVRSLCCMVVFLFVQLIVKPRYLKKIK
jgi:teichuronic acid biosynthesis glycosyltransferase TuaG